MLQYSRAWKVALVLVFSLSVFLPPAASADDPSAGVALAVDGAARGDNSYGYPLPYTFSGSTGTQSAPVNITFVNTGTTTWTTAGNYGVRTASTHQHFSLGNPIAQGGCDGVPPGGGCSWTQTLNFGPTAGTGTDYYQLYHNGSPFGGRITANIIVT